MAETLNDNLENLRKRSQTLLTRIDKNSKKINAEVKKLYSETLPSINCDGQKDKDHYIRKNTDLEELCDDSSAVNIVSCPDYSSISRKRLTESILDMTSPEKLLLISNKPREQYLKILPRKPIKECYCYSEVNKLYAKSLKTQHKSISPCHRCKSQIEFRPIDKSNDKMALTLPISCEIYSRVKKIDYVPRSQFLRNVQKKICELQTGEGQGDCLRICPRSSSYHTFMTRMQDIVPDKIAQFPDEHKYIQGKQAFLKASANSLASERSESDHDDMTQSVCVSSKGAQVSTQKLTKPIFRKTIKSRKQISEENLSLKSSIEDKRTTPLHKQDCSCYDRNEPKKIIRCSEDKYAGRCNLSEYCQQRDRCLKHDDDSTDSMDQEIDDLRKFREQNYFETHGTSHTLMSSRSSGSLEQYLLNERLFPESVGRIHRQNLVVTMPPCATTQRKRIHYFPRNVVRQEKNIYNTNYRRKRCQSCPLTGHAIDLGIFKVKPPINSLALKFQTKAI